MNEKSLVLIVEDSPEDVRIYRRMLERSDNWACWVADVSTGKEGLAFLASQPAGAAAVPYFFENSYRYRPQPAFLQGPDRAFQRLQQSL